MSAGAAVQPAQLEKVALFFKAGQETVKPEKAKALSSTCMQKAVTGQEEECAVLSIQLSLSQASPLPAFPKAHYSALVLIFTI